MTKYTNFMIEDAKRQARFWRRVSLILLVLAAFGWALALRIVYLLVGAL